MTSYSPTQVNTILRRLSTQAAEGYQSEVLYPQMAKAMRLSGASPAEVREALAEAYYAFRVMLGYYAFAKRGSDRFEYASYALEAFDRATGGTPAGFTALLVSGEASQRLWNEFVRVCEEHRRKVNEQLNRGLLEGLAEFATRIYREDEIGNIWTTIHQAIVRSGRVEPIYQTIVEIRGIGPKVGSLLLRDMVALYNLEADILPLDYHYLQPVDAWIRRIGPLLTPELTEGSADWIIAGKLAKLCRRNQVSGVRFNQGVQYLAVVEVQNINNLKAYLDHVAGVTVGGVELRAVRS